MSYFIKKKKNLFFLAILLFLVLFTVFFLYKEEDLSTIDVRINETNIKAEVAQTKQERIQGLSGRSSIKETDGLLMIFPDEDRHGIWMKDMKFSIDIIWIDGSGKIVHLEENVHPGTYPDVFIPKKSALMVLEVRSGKVKKERWAVGDKVFLENGDYF